MDYPHRADEPTETNNTAAMSGMEAPVTLVLAEPDDRAGEETSEGAIGAEQPGAEQAKAECPKEALLNGASTQAINASVQPPDAGGMETDETESAMNRAQPQQHALGAGSPPPIADADIRNPDEFKYKGAKLLAGLDELMRKADEPVDRVIDPFESETLAIATGEPGRGKSLLGITLAVATAAGVDFGDFKPSSPQSVVIFSPEDKLRTIGARIKAAMEELRANPELVARNLRVMQAPGSSVIFEGVGETLDFNALGRALRQIIQGRRARFVVLDPFIELHTADENSNMQIHALLAMLRTLARETSSVIFLTHHSAKGGQGPRGAGAFMGTVRAALHVEALGKKEAKAAEAMGLKPSGIFRLMSLKDSYNEDGAGGVYFQRVSIRPGEAPVLRRVALDVQESE